MTSANHRRRQTREEIAAIELGHTAITTAQKRVLIGFFLVLIFSVPVMQSVHEWRAWRAGLPGHESPRPACRQLAAGLPKAAAVLVHGRPPTEPRMTIPDGAGFMRRVFLANSVLLHDMNVFEEELSKRSLLTENLVPPAQLFLAGALGAGNEKAYPGRDGWLYYRPGVDYLTGRGFLEEKQLRQRAQSGTEWRAAPQPDPVIAILQFHKQLAERDIRLVVVPAPVKGSLRPGQFTSRRPDIPIPIQNLSYAQFREELEQPELFFRRYTALLDEMRAIPEARARRSWFWPLLQALNELDAARETILSQPALFFDPAPALARDASKKEPLFLATDTHWGPWAMRHSAEELAAFLRGHNLVPAEGDINYERERASVTNLGDLAVMMRLPAGQRLYDPETVNVQTVTRERQLWRSVPWAQVLLLGDSFSNVFSMRAMGWGEAAGFAEQLSAALQQPLDAIVRNDAGAHSTRQMLSDELARGNDRLAGKKVVIWEFAARELAVGDWRVDATPMKLGLPREGSFLEIAPARILVIEGTVREVTSSPRPGTVTYADHVVQIHLDDLEQADGQTPGADNVLVAALGMSRHTWTRAARLRVGQRVRMRLHNYDEIDARLKIDGLNCAELDSEAGLEIPCWGEFAGADGSATDDQAPFRPFGLPETAAIAGVILAMAAVVRRAEKHEQNKQDQS